MAIEAKERIQHDGKVFNPGDIIGDGDITEAQAEQLIASNSAVKVGSQNTVGGEKAEPNPSRIKDTLKNQPKDGKRLTVAEKAQARNSKESETVGDVPAKTEDVDAPVVLPESFTGVDGEYAVVLNAKGKVYKYTKDGATIKKAEYQSAFEASEAKDAA